MHSYIDRIIFVALQIKTRLNRIDEEGTVVEGTIQKLFEGHRMNYIECINVVFKSTRKNHFMIFNLM
nr:ubiquitin carboxyl-terminal hydrolase 12-like isoform X2 [Tanacetum cinerariifolium]